LIIAGGLLSVLMGRGSLNGIWLSVVGWFLIMASRMEENSASLLHGLEGLRACDVMAYPAVAPGWLTVDGFTRSYPGGSPVWLLEQWGGGVVSLVTPSMLHAVPQSRWHEVRAIDVAVPLSGLPLAPPLEPAGAVLRRMAEREASWMLVVDGGRIVGLINEQMLTAAASRHSRPGADAATPPPTPTPVS
jgi:hypothetical protein